jgi:hypothetical protein
MDALSCTLRRSAPVVPPDVQCLIGGFPPTPQERDDRGSPPPHIAATMRKSLTSIQCFVEGCPEAILLKTTS